jgi:hypothetical protein
MLIGDLGNQLSSLIGSSARGSAITVLMRMSRFWTTSI